jgi:hypothetical protein
MRNERAVKTELNRIEMLKHQSRGMTEAKWHELSGAQQALTWVLEDNAMSESRLWKMKSKMPSSAS